jgi:uncharacterized membrane protein
MTAGVDIGRRVLAIDWMRGFVMVLMALDHASETWNADRFSADSAYLLDPSTGVPVFLPGTVIPAVDFLTRWVTHLCAPTFLFLSGTSLALSVEKRAQAGEAPGTLDRHLFVRALVILGLEGCLSLLAGMGILMLQVLFAIGMSLLVMIFLRRLPTSWLVGGALGWFVVGEWVTRSVVPIGSTDIPVLSLLTLAPAYGRPLICIYPFPHWLAMMMLGWGFGRFLLAQPPGLQGRRVVEGLLVRGGAGSLLLFLVVRGIDAYGNMGLHRVDGSWIRWLHVSKYPPALSFVTLELGLMALFLAGFMKLERLRPGPAWDWNPMLVLGQTALFFYVLHFILLGASAQIIAGGMRMHGLPETYLVAGIVVVVLYPVCGAYRAYKRAHPRGFAQYI